MEEDRVAVSVGAEGEPRLEMIAGVWVLTGIDSGSAETFRGVALAPSLEAHCWTEKVAEGRSVRVLGSASLEDAEREADVLSNQMSLSL